MRTASKYTPLSAEIFRGAIPLTQLEMHDALIVATALHLDLPLMTQDQNIIDSKLVEVFGVRVEFIRP